MNTSSIYKINRRERIKPEDNKPESVFMPMFRMRHISTHIHTGAGKTPLNHPNTDESSTNLQVML